MTIPFSAIEDIRQLFFKWRPRQAVVLLCLQLICLLGHVFQATGEDVSKHEIQAAMVIKFTDFIQWPDDSFGEKEAEWFTIAVLGDKAYEGMFEMFTDRMFQKKKLRVIHYPRDLDLSSLEIGDVQILLVSQSSKKQIQALLDNLSGRPVLTIGDFPGFAEKGGIINFYPKPNNLIGFEINITAKDRSRIKISSYLLRLAKIISP